MKPRRGNLRHMLFGDRRDQRIAIREAGFTDDAEAATWAGGVLHQAQISPSEKLHAMAALRRRRPDLTLATTKYILHQAQLRSID
ncbi:hypothetical protein I2485_04275 [Nesterenkonia sp. E16_7]|uniref:hypothetical protein n=1 Tax=unclassified Nesterenkonia TaxID=2629769 RepID=UPI001A91F02D|nr:MULTISPECIES: hypothetical protein [unclassified Nesterenkonia]MBO0596516.1 hypothetical protein [Nesterenkonia sp. E16_10]MBO0597862.1 hypothetical protein [Nesterenkonia sp. E16_7]